MPTKRKVVEPRRVLPEGLPYIPYVRVSDRNGREGESYTSPTDQLRSIDGTARRLEVGLFPGEFTDEDKTGATFERPGWERALELIRDGKAAGIIAYNLARMTRAKTGEVLMMVEDVESVGGRLYDEHGRVSVEDADDELVTTVKAMMNRREWRQRRRDRMRSVENAIRRGVHLAAPYGYMKGPDKRLVVVKDEAEQVKKAFEFRAAGMTWPAIADQLNMFGADPRPYKRDGEVRQAVWTHKTVRGIVMNEVYVGTAYNGDWETPHAHEAIVSPELFARAHRTKGTKPLGPGEGYLLSGLVRCANCGYAMVHQLERGRRYYRCLARQHGDGRCPAPVNVNAVDLENYVWSEFVGNYLLGENDVMYAVSDDSDVRQAEERVESLKARSAGSMRLVVLAVTDSQREQAEQMVREVGIELARAESDLLQAQMRARGADLPPELDVDTAERAPVQEQRHWLSLVYACVVVRRATRRLEPVADRVGPRGIVSMTDAPFRSGALRDYVRGLAV